MATFSFSFSGDDIEDDVGETRNGSSGNGREGVENTPPPPPPPSAFPVQGKPMLPPVRHDLHEMLGKLPSKIAYGTLEVDLDGKGTTRIPRRELWDIRVQLMAEAEAEDDVELEPGLGRHDVKTGIYEGGFKSWESSLDLVKVLLSGHLPAVDALGDAPLRFIELGCGTALPSVAVFQRAGLGQGPPLHMTVSDYNPSVLHLATLPNLLLAWALHHRDSNPVVQEAFGTEGELELPPEVKEAFVSFLLTSNIVLSFVSGGWSPEFVDLLYQPAATPDLFAESGVVVVGAETIYSPFALSLFAETLLSILRRESQARPTPQAVAVVAAKRLYFGVGGSLDDFVDKMRSSGALVEGIREETEGVRRGVVQCLLR